MSKSSKSFRTPMGRVRSLGAARLGTDEASTLHLTAVALVPLTIGFVWVLLTLLHMDYHHARQTLGEPLPAIVMLLFVLTGVYHMQIGMRAIILDYVHGHAREWALIANILFAAALGMACAYAVLRIGFV